MPSNYLPRKEAELVTWTGTFVENLTPLATGSFPITADRLAEYVTTRNRFVAAYNKAINPATRTKPAVNEKSVQRQILVRSTRSMVDVLQAWPQMTNTLREELGIALRGKKPEPSPVPGRPVLKVESVNERDVTVSIGQTTNSRALPKGVSGASVMVAYGAKPESTSDWTFKELVGKTKVTITLDAVTEATTAWITAFWFNGRKQTGPAANPVSVKLSEMEIVPVTSSMKIRKAA